MTRKPYRKFDVETASEDHQPYPLPRGTGGKCPRPKDEGECHCAKIGTTDDNCPFDPLVRAWRSGRP